MSNTQTGKEVQGLLIGRGIDDLTFDPQGKRLYASRGAQAATVCVYQESSADDHESSAGAASESGERKSHHVASLHERYVSVPAHQGAAVEIFVYQDR